MLRTPWTWLVVWALGLLALLSAPRECPAQDVKLVDFDGGYFNLTVPDGWYVYSAGACDAWMVRVYHPDYPALQFFWIMQSIAFYTNANQRALDAQTANLYGYPEWYDTPAVVPLDCATFFGLWSQLGRLPRLLQTVPYLPKLDNLRVVNSQPWTGVVEGRTELVYASFSEDGASGEGYFTATLSELWPYTGQPWAGIGMARMVFGVCAPPGQLEAWAPIMRGCLESIEFDAEYSEDCRKSQEKRNEQAQRASSPLGLSGGELSAPVVTGDDVRRAAREFGAAVAELLAQEAEPASAP